MTSCMPPDSSKKRSNTIVFCVGSVPSAARAAARYSTSCSAGDAREPKLARQRSRARSALSSRASTSSRSRDTASESSSVRPGASPSQNGMVGGWPCASSTRTRPASTRRIRYDVLPSWKMSPARLSIAKSSLTRADELARGLEHDVVVGGVGNRAARGDRGEARAAPAAQHAIHRIAMHVRRAMAAARAEPFGDHAHDGEILVARQRRVGIRTRERRRTARPRSIRAPPPRPRSAGRARRAASAGSRCGRARRAARRRAAPRTRPARRATTGKAAPSAAR